MRMATTWILAVLVFNAFLAIEIQGLSEPHLKITFAPRSEKIKPTFVDIEIYPPHIIMDHISLHYPQTIQRRLFSSVPYREWAINDVKLEINPGSFYLLTGPSNSGKSCILKLVARQEAPTKGGVAIKTGALDGEGSEWIGGAKPIVLDQRKRPLDNKFENIQDLLLDHAMTCFGDKIWFGREEDLEMVQHLVHYLGDTLFEVDSNSNGWKDLSPGDLSSSQSYLVQSAFASLSSILDHPLSTPLICSEGRLQYALAAPVLLLDEWLDLETSLVVGGVQSGLERLTQRWGAVILCVTHRPERFRAPVQQLRLLSGRLQNNIPL